MRIQKLFDSIDKNAFIVLSAPPDMQYYANFTGEGYVLLSQSVRRIYTDGRYTEQAQKQAPTFDICDVRGFWKELKLLNKPILFQPQHLSYQTYQGAVKLGIELVPAEISFAELRSVKSDEEISCLQQAAEIAEKAYADTLNFIRPGQTEKEIAAYLNYKMVCFGGQKTSFDTICISGKNTSLPHGVPSDKVVQEGELLTMDFGCIYNGYCSDMTRTVAVGYLSDEMEWVFDIVLRAQDTLERTIKPGMTAGEADEIARKIIVDAEYGEYFVHSTGHGVGLEIHEFPNLAPNKETVLQKNQVVTVEPGIYLPDKFGVRIENTVVLTDNGAFSLQKSDKELIIL
ncbi:MAG: aminopeptidase P family protein [Clostridia bacterium]|nr:aminopeptidase P family protein [Clostridia bacterium]